MRLFNIYQIWMKRFELRMLFIGWRYLSLLRLWQSGFGYLSFCDTKLNQVTFGVALFNLLSPLLLLLTVQSHFVALVLRVYKFHLYFSVWPLTSVCDGVWFVSAKILLVIVKNSIYNLDVRIINCKQFQTHL